MAGNFSFFHPVIGTFGHLLLSKTRTSWKFREFAHTQFWQKFRETSKFQRASLKATFTQKASRH